VRVLLHQWNLPLKINLFAVRRKRESTARVEYTGPRSPVSSYIQLKYDEMEGNV